jgi:translation initiation factor IF-3
LKYYRLNNQIIARLVHLIDEDGSYLGDVDLREALKMAQEKSLDLVEIGPKENPPIAKILDFGKFKYELRKKDKQQKKQQKVGEIKVIRLSFRIGRHDLETRANKAKEFLIEKQKVKIEIILRGREKVHAELAENVIKQFIEILGNVKIEQEPKRQANQITALISSN